MRINADFSQPVTIRPEDYAWVASPASGVDRMMLDRIGEEVARATTIVRFAPDSQFDSHEHGGGEEFLVLEGVFSDEHADYPAGTYVRNPIGTAHRPHIGPEGAKILVKLHQFQVDDTEQKVIDTRNGSYAEGAAPGVSEMVLHQVPSETVRMVRLAAGADLPTPEVGTAEEIFVVEGQLTGAGDAYPQGTWLRSPDNATRALSAETEALLFIKTGHLPRDA